MQYLWDETGKQYLDAIAGIVTVSVGHCHPKVTERARQQAAQLVHATTIYLHPNIAQFAQALARRMPEGSDLRVSYFTNSGSEANDLAILMARMHTERDEVLALRNAYHGGTHVALSLTAVGTWRYPVPAMAGVRHITPGYCYRCPFGLTYPACDMKCAHDVENVIRYETCGEIACVIAEPIQGVGGAVTPPPEYYRIVYDIVRQHGGLCIADEVQTGFGRTGEHFWGFENWGVTPDIVIMAKGIGNGAPLGAVTTRPEIAAHMGKRIHFNTFGGNPVSMSQGLATLEVIEEENIQQKAKDVGGYLKDRLLALADKHDLIGDVRGLGLMLGLELVKNRKTKEPASAETADIVELAKDRGLLVGKGGLFGNVIRLKPPMCITKPDCDFLADCLDECMEQVGKTS
jgi:alanine-glyoxylate transaminase/(R)-3-amino-2-methylpropionate-pyruvate transaminase